MESLAYRPYFSSRVLRLLVWLTTILALSACGDHPPNDPYGGGVAGSKVLYGAFSERPKHLDPALSYSEEEARIIAQIYEPLLQFHYLIRPYTLEPLTATQMPVIHYLDTNQQPLPSDAPEETIVYSDYEIELQPGIRYQPHPAFAKSSDGRFRYHGLSESELSEIHGLGDFAETGTRELSAEDYVYAIKRLVHPKIHSPIAELMQEHIVGLKELAGALQAAYGKQGKPPGFFDIRHFPLTGVTATDGRHLRIRLQGKYPQFRFWLAMTLFSPMPWEADAFYAQPGLIAKNISLDWYPVGTGPYMLVENNPNRRMVLARNPNYHGDFYPTSGEPEDAALGLLKDAGKRLPLIDRVVYTLEKESIPYWNKFLQGYYDASGLGSDTFDQAVRFGGQGEAQLTAEMEAKHIRLETEVAATTSYMGFNMQDPVVGGLDEAHCKLRQAIGIAVDYEEFIAIFANGRGVPAQGTIPPGIYGYEPGESGINPYVYRWQDGAAKRRDIADAKALLAEAGYPGGVEAKSGQPLVLYLDTVASGPDSKSVLNWYRKQFAKLGIQLVLRTSDYNQFQQKMLAGNAQIYMWGWNADYPDPENFLFLLFGPNAKAGKGGENASNYANPRFDELFLKMRNMDDGPERLALIRQMQDLARHDAPWLFGYHPKDFALYHEWYHNLKSNLMARNRLKYQRIDPELREQRRREWNRPVYWPLAAGAVLGLLAILPAWIKYRQRRRATAL